MESSTDFEVFQFKAAWQLPSVSAECCLVQAYLKFSGADYKVVDCNVQKMSPSGELPVLRDGQQLFAESPAIIKQLKAKGFDIDHELSRLQRAETRAFTELIRRALGDALRYTWWLDGSGNVALATELLLQQDVRWPLRSLLARRARSEAALLLLASSSSRTRPARQPPPAAAAAAADVNKPHQHQQPSTPAAVAPATVLRRLSVLQQLPQLLFGGGFSSAAELVDAATIKREAARCLEAASARLGDHLFVFGDTPSSLDAVMFGYIAVALLAPLPDDWLAQLVRRHGNLVDYVERLHADYFGSQLRGPRVQRRWPPPLVADSDDDDLPPPPMSDAADAGAAAGSSSEPLSADERAYRRRNVLWLGLAAAIFGVFTLASGGASALLPTRSGYGRRVVRQAAANEHLYDDDDDDDDDDEDGEDVVFDDDDDNEAEED